MALDLSLRHAENRGLIHPAFREGFGFACRGGGAGGELGVGLIGGELLIGDGHDLGSKKDWLASVRALGEPG
jgi:hypothetical protein